MHHAWRSATRSGLFTLLLACAAAVWLTACGGGGEDDRNDYQRLADEAQDLRRQAVGLVQSAPCSADHQCAGLVFAFAEPTCRQHDQHTYSRLSPLMLEAERVAAQQRDVARRALSISTFPPVVCTAQVDPEPRHVCVNLRCEQRAGNP
jgi:hypothetical protein